MEVAAIDVSYAPSPPLTSNTVQGALDEVAATFLPMAGGTILGPLTVTSSVDAALARSRVVIVRCDGANPTCDGPVLCDLVIHAGAACAGPCGVSDAGSCTATCPNSRVAIAGGCNNGPTPGLSACQPSGANSWQTVAYGPGNLPTTTVTCLDLR